MFRTSTAETAGSNFICAILFGAVGYALNFFFGDSLIVSISGFVLAGLGAIIGSCIYIVPQKNVAIIERFGKFNAYAEAGLNLKAPWPIDIIKGNLSMQYHTISASVDCKTKDNVFMKVPVQNQVNVIVGKEVEAFYDLDNPAAQIEDYCVNAIRSKVSEMKLEAVYENKDELESSVKTALNNPIGEFGFALKNVIVQDPMLPDTVQESYNRVMASVRDKEAAENEAAAIKIKHIGNAEAEAESMKLRADAYVDYRTKLAEGNSEAMKKFIGDDTNITQKDVMGFFAMMDRLDALRDASKNAGTLIVTDTNTSLNESRGIDVAQIVAAVKALEFTNQTNSVDGGINTQRGA